MQLSKNHDMFFLTITMDLQYKKQPNSDESEFTNPMGFDQPCRWNHMTYLRVNLPKLGEF